MWKAITLFLIANLECVVWLAALQNKQSYFPLTKFHIILAAGVSRVVGRGDQMGRPE